MITTAQQLAEHIYGMLLIDKPREQVINDIAESINILIAKSIVMYANNEALRNAPSAVGESIKVQGDGNVTLIPKVNVGSRRW